MSQGHPIIKLRRTDLEDPQKGDILKASAESQGMSPGPAWAPVWLNTGRSNQRLLKGDLRPERRVEWRGCIRCLQLAASRAKTSAVPAEDRKPRVPQNTRRNAAAFIPLGEKAWGQALCGNIGSGNNQVTV